MFDREIIKNSMEKGVEVFLENRVLSFQRSEDKIELKTSKSDYIDCKILIGADGPYSKTRKRFGLPQPTEILRGIGAEVKNVKLNPDFVEIFVGKKIAPGFFAWMIPINKKGTEARIGLCVSPGSPYPPSYYFSNLFKNKYSSNYLNCAKKKKRPV